MHLIAFASTLVLSLAIASSAFAESTIQLAAGAHERSVRLAGNIDSWVAFTIVVFSLATAWSMNNHVRRARAFGTLLAALGCIGVAAWFFFFVIDTGFLENPKPNQTPLDSAKPILLWSQAIISALAGFSLLVLFGRQINDKEALNLPMKNSKDRYGNISRLLHWTTAFMFLALIPMGIFASIIPEGTEYRYAYYVVHKTVGVIVFLLLVLRLLWNNISQRPSLDTSITPRERKLARSVHLMLYFMMIAIPVTGFVMTSSHGYPTFFFAWELAPLWPASDSATIIWGSLHKYLLPYLLYIVLGAHILGALKHRFIDKHGKTIGRMMS